MRYLLISLGSRGSINPIIGLGMGLKKRGHCVTVISFAIYRNLVQKSELDFIAAGQDALEVMSDLDNTDWFHPRHNMKLIMDAFFLGPLQEIYDIIAGFDPKDTVVVANVFVLGARLASEKLGFRLASLAIQPAALWSVLEPPHFRLHDYFQKSPRLLKSLMLNALDKYYLDRLLRPKLNEFRQTLGLMPVSRVFSRWRYSPMLVLGLFPEWFAAPAADWPAQTHLAGFIHFDENPEEELSAEVKQFLGNGEPPLVFTYGTAMKQGHRFFVNSYEAIRILGWRAIFLTNHAAQLPERELDDVLYAAYIPFKKLLPHVAGLVHHGGIGTIAQALAEGVPQLVVSYAFDQPDNGYRLQQLGAGFAMQEKQYSVSRAVDNLQQLLSSTKIREAAQHYGEKINFTVAIETACDLLEKI